MAIDISEELDDIKNESLLGAVRSAIANGAQTISDATKESDITEELITIRNGRYGVDIRMAIHDALMKLANSSRPYSGYQVIRGVLYEEISVIDGDIIGVFSEVEEEGGD